MDPGTNGPANAATNRPEPPHSPDQLDGCVVRVAPERAVLPAECACCGAAASRTTRETRGLDAASLLIPYCAVCHAHVSRGATRRLAVGMASAILAVTLVFGLPLAGRPRGLLGYWLLVSLGASLPFLLARRFAEVRGRGHAAASRAAWFRADGALLCARPAWGERVAHASAAEFSSARLREPWSPWWAAFVAVAAIVVAPFIHRYEFPLVRIVNVTDQALTISLDDHVLVRVDSTSAESSNAGVSVRIPAGVRSFVATSADGRVVDTARVIVHPGSPHLYAPGKNGTPTCFWTETAGYGQSRDENAETTALTGEPAFWELPGDVDFWFSAPPIDAGGRSSGGIVRAVRQARCEDAPAR